MTGIIINPGTGAVKNAIEEEAIKNMKQFIKDIPAKTGVYFERNPKYDEDGRFSFRVFKEGQPVNAIVDMPGLPVEKVRYMKEPDQNIWNYPRLYLDGSSWVWYYAISFLTDDYFAGINKD